MNIKPHLFLRTYKGDRDWLPYLFRSIAKHAPDVGLTVVAPKGHDVGVAVTIHTDPVHGDDYINQQYDKLHADLYVPEGTTHIVHIDSDCILTAPLDGLFRDGKPIMLHTPWEQVGDAKCWHPITERLLGFEAPYEFMRRMPLVYPTDVYSGLRWHLESEHKTFMRSLIGNVKGRNLSEFNLLGSFCWEHFYGEFCWINTAEKELPPLVARQGWSWGGVDRAKDEWEALLA